MEVEKQKRPLPEITLYSNDLPGLKNLKIGDKTNLIVKVELTKMGKGDEYGPMFGEKESKEIFGRFKIMEVKEEKSDKLAKADTPAKFGKLKGQMMAERNS